MSSIGLLRKLGVYIDENFFTAEFCADLCSQMEQAPKVAAGVYNQEQDATIVDGSQRRTLYSRPSARHYTQVEEQIKALKPRLEAFFAGTYSDSIEGPKFLLYQKGDFFGAHTDDQLGRKINITIFLNNERCTPQPDCYVGGTLKLYGLFNHPQWQTKGISVPGQAGLLVAYAVDVVHEVTAIEDGRRFAVVSRLLAPGSKFEA